MNRTNVFDVASYILQKQGRMTTWKLQKLVYYCQAWSLVWIEEPLFPERIEAWADGPVCPDLYQEHKGFLHLDLDNFSQGDYRSLGGEQKEIIDEVLAFYGERSGRYLSNLTHLERPWIEARGDLKPGRTGHTEIDYDTMVDYYGGLIDDSQCEEEED